MSSEKDFIIRLGDLVLKEATRLASEVKTSKDKPSYESELKTAKYGAFASAVKKLKEEGVDTSHLKNYNNTPLTTRELEKGELFRIPKPDSGEDLILKYIQDHGPITNIINSYNKFYDEVIEIVKSTVLQAGNGQIFTFENVTIERPTIKERLITPQEARTNNYNYFCPIIASIRVYNLKESEAYRKGKPLDKSKGKLLDPVVLDEIPCMLNSNRCYLQTEKGEDRANFLAQAGEDVTDQFGYFVAGGEHIMIIAEKLRMLKLIIHLYKGKLEGSLTIPGKWSSIKINTEFDEKGDLLLKHSKLKTKDSKVNIFHLFAIIDRLARGEDEKDEVDENASKKSFNRGEQAIISLCPQGTVGAVRTFIKIPYSSLDPYAEHAKTMESEKLDAFVKDDLFPHIPEENYTEKFYLLAVIANRMFMCKSKTAEPDDRDSWAHKRLSGPAATMSHYFRRFWNSFTKRFTEKTANLGEAKDWPEPGEKMWTNFRKGFATGAWGEKKTLKKNVTQRAIRHNSLALLSHTTTVDVQADKKNQNGARAMQADQYGYICSVFTPEGKDTGIRKMLAITCKITDETKDNDNDLVRRTILSDKIKKKYEINELNDDVESEKMASSKKGQYLILFNLRPLAWSNVELADFLRAERRVGTLPMDMEVVVEGKFIYIHTDGSRIVRPVLVVDQESGKLLIDKLNLRNDSMETILSNGCIDYISPWEQNYLKVAVYPKDLDVLTEERKELNKARLQLSAVVDEIKDADGEEEEEKVLKEVNKKLNLNCNTVDELLKVVMKYRDEAKASFDFKRFYTHCEIDPITQFGVSAIFIPAPQHNPAARNVYQTSMNRQALSNPHSNNRNRTDAERKELLSIQRPVFSNVFANFFGLDVRSHTQNVVIAFMTGSPYIPFKDYETFDERVISGARFIENQAGKCQEDNISLKKEAVQRGLFLSTLYYVVSTTVGRVSNDIEKIEKPVPSENEDKNRYHAIDEKGLPIIGSYIKYKDCVIGKVLHKKVGNEVILENKSEFAEKNVSGYIQNVILYKDNNGNDVITVKIAQTGYFNESNKIAAIPAQKGTVNFISILDLPYTAEGVVPDMLINPHSIASRQTLSYILEALIGKLTMLTGEKVDATAFREFDIPTIVRKMAQIGVNPMGYETLYHPMTGKPLPGKAFIGVASIQVLRHFADQKMQSRGWYGSTNSKTRQPNKPSSGSMTTAGGNRLGEQERDALAAHGAAGVVHQGLYNMSDRHSIPICPDCKTSIIKKFEHNSFYCQKCEKDVDNYYKGNIRYATLYTNHLAAALGVGTEYQWSTKKDMRKTLKEKQSEISNEGFVEGLEEGIEEEDEDY